MLCSAFMCGQYLYWYMTLFGSHFVQVILTALGLKGHLLMWDFRYLQRQERMIEWVRQTDRQTDWDWDCVCVVCVCNLPHLRKDPLLFCRAVRADPLLFWHLYRPLVLREVRAVWMFCLEMGDEGLVAAGCSGATLMGAGFLEKTKTESIVLRNVAIVLAFKAIVPSIVRAWKLTFSNLPTFLPCQEARCMFWPGFVLKILSHPLMGHT